MPTLKRKDKEKQIKKARGNLKQNNVAVAKTKEGTFKFVFPKHLEERLRKEYNFSVDMLSVGGDIPLPELAVHIDEHSSMEAYAGVLAEYVRHQLQVARDEYNRWHDRIHFECKRHLAKKKASGLTEKYVNGYISKKYTKELKEKQNKVSALEMQYRMLNNVIKASLVTKGTLLPTLRNIIQGKADVGIGKVNRKRAMKIREKLNMEGEKHGSKKKKKKKKG